MKNKIDYWDIKENGMLPAIITRIELGEFVYYIVDLKRKVKLHKTRKAVEAIMTLEMMQQKYSDNSELEDRLEKEMELEFEKFKDFGETMEKFYKTNQILSTIDNMNKKELVEIIKGNDLNIKYSKYKKEELAGIIRKELEEAV